MDFENLHQVCSDINQVLQEPSFHENILQVALHILKSVHDLDVVKTPSMKNVLNEIYHIAIGLMDQSESSIPNY